MNRIAIVTGGCRGIGLAVSRRLTADGFQVACGGRRSEEAVADALAEIGKEGGYPLYV